MSAIETLLHEMQSAPDAMLEEVLDFVQFLKSGRFATTAGNGSAGSDAHIELIFDRPRTLRDMAEEQRIFLASLTTPLADIDLPSEET